MSDLQEILDFVLSDPEHIDHGWLITEKDSIYHSKLTRALEYIRNNAAENVLILDKGESILMADAMGSTDTTIRRHIIVQLVTFQFITRDISTPSWKLELTKNGNDYINSQNKKKYFQENVVEKLVFCNENWAPPERVRAYNDFNVRPFEIMEKIMPQIGNVLYLNEMAYFVSKIKNKTDDIERICSLIKLYRNLTILERDSLNNRIKNLLNTVSKEKFGNWRKNNKRNFEFLSMGNKFSMTDKVRGLVDTAYLSTAQIDIEHSPLIEYITHISEESTVVECPRDDMEVNSGIEGEIILINALNELGFKTKNVAGSNKGGYDIIAFRDDTKFYFEVKSSNKLCSPTLTENEFKEAQNLREHYILAIVEHVFSNPIIYYVFDPATRLRDKIEQRKTLSYNIARSNWLSVAQQQIE